MIDPLPIVEPPNPAHRNSPRRRFKRYLLHAIRIAIVIGIVLLIRTKAKHVRMAKADRLSELATIALVQTKLPTAESIASSPSDDGRYAVKNSEDAVVGYVQQTSPAADHIIGFSGPTNVLAIQDLEYFIVGIEFLESGDTREHVRQVVEDSRFRNSFVGVPVASLADHSVDAVTGATLTSLAIAESLRTLSGGEPATRKSLRFGESISLIECQKLFPDAKQLDESGNVIDKTGKPIGSVLRTSPAADNIVGYQGPTDALLGFDADGKVIGLTLLKTFDNEKYVTYVREDTYFLSLFNEQTLQKLSGLDSEGAEIEGVSGATMTSMAVADGVFTAAATEWKRQLETESADQTKQEKRVEANPLLSVNALTTLAAIVVGILICFSSLRGKVWVRVPFQIFLVVYLGFVNGGLISQAMFVGWAKNGVPWLAAIGLVMLAIAAILLPAFTGRNTYCTHICPHGAAQQLLANRVKQKKLGPKWRRLLKTIPVALLIFVIVVAMKPGLVSGISLVDIEAFDAYVPTIAGWLPIAIAVGGLTASLFVPMAYCRYGCPTGAVLEFLRFNRGSDEFSFRDIVVLGLLMIAVALFL